MHCSVAQRLMIENIDSAQFMSERIVQLKLYSIHFCQSAH